MLVRLDFPDSTSDAGALSASKPGDTLEGMAYNVSKQSGEW